MLPQNQEALARRYPGLLRGLAGWRALAARFRLTRADSGEPVLWARLRDGREIPLCHPRDPETEAEAQVARFQPRAGESVLVLGFGLGHHVRALLDAVGSEGRVSVVLLHPASLLLALGELDRSPLLADPRCELIWGGPPTLAAALGRQVGPMPRIYYHEPSLLAADDELRPVTEAVRRVRRERDRLMLTAPLLRENYRRNLGWAWAARGVDELRGELAGRPAVVIAAGPSLDRNVARLATIQGRVPVLCVDTAARRVIQAGVRPDLLLTIDPHRGSLHHLDAVDLTLPLAFLPSTFPEVLAQHRGPKLVAFARGDRLGERLHQLSGKGLVEVAGTVSYFAIELARRWGCDPVIFIGLDLALTDGRDHCAMARSTPLAGERLAVRASSGGQVLTTMTLQQFRQAIELRVASDPGCTFVNATEGGAHIAGTLHCSLAEALERWGRGPAWPRELLGGPATPRAPAPAPWVEAWSEIYAANDCPPPADVVGRADRPQRPRVPQPRP